MPEVLHQQSILHQHQDIHLSQQGKGEWTALQPSDQQLESGTAAPLRH